MRLAFVGLLSLFILVFAEIHDSTNGRLFVGSDFDQIKSLVPRLLKCIPGGHDSQLFTFGRNDSDLSDSDLFIDPRRIAFDVFFLS